MNMMIRNQILVLLFSAIFFSGVAQTGKPGVGLYLFTDREFCVSGDTVWFKVAPENMEYSSNVVHVQLSGADGNAITSVIKKFTENWAEGYIHIPDSLSSGVYFLSAFFYEFLSVPGVQVEMKSLFVYNRFQRDMQEIVVPAKENQTTKTNRGQSVAIQPEKRKYGTRETVTVELGLGDLNRNEMNKVVVKASLADDLAWETGGRFLATSAVSPIAVPQFKEKDGFIFSGKVTEAGSDKSPEKAVVFLSLPENPRFLDYYVTGSNGYFYFFLKNAVGMGDAVIQAVSENGTELQIHPESGAMRIQRPLAMQKQILSQNQINFVNVSADAGFIQRLFQENYTITPRRFSMPERFAIPVYGYPQRTVNLADFFQLNSFREISRELLPGVQYRNRRGNTTIRMLNWDENAYFESEPFKLVNGVPVFNNRLFRSIPATDIAHIEYTMQDRLFGDLRFSGILALYLNDNSIRWLANQRNFFQFPVLGLQPESQRELMPNPGSEKNIPDLRTVFFWQLMEPGENEPISFQLSDRKGKVEVSVEGIGNDGLPFKFSEIIEVK